MKHTSAGLALLGAGLFSWLWFANLYADADPNPEQEHNFFQEHGLIHFDVRLDAGLLPFLASERQFRLLNTGKVNADLECTEWLFLQGEGGVLIPFFNAGPEFFLNTLIARLTWDQFSVLTGAIVPSWSQMRTAKYVDRSNPMDLRQNGNIAYVPLWGLQIQRWLEEGTLEGFVAMDLFNPLGGWIASEQRNFPIGRYQQALARDPLDGVFGSTAQEVANQQASMHGWVPSVGGIYRFHALSSTWGLSAVLHGNEVPKVEADSEGKLLLRYLPMLSFGVDGSVELPWAIARWEWVVAPLFSEQFGKTAIVRSIGGEIHSTASAWSAMAVGLDASYGDLISAGVELLSNIWTHIPAYQWLYGVEPIGELPKEERWLTRFALGLELSGKLADNQLSWELRGETGLFALDVLVGLDLKYDLWNEKTFVGAHVDYANGALGTPGWMRAYQTGFSLYMEHHFL